VWYIDAWAVLDGLAFASEREPDSLKASTTVFLSVPDLEPIPVGRLSTALRAQRASFQEGFRNDAGSELGLTTLEQVQELVRRAYLGGGLGPEPVPAEPRPVDPLLVEPGGVPRPVTPWTGGGDHYQRELKKFPPAAWNTLLDIDFGDLQEPKARRALLRKLYRRHDALALYSLLQSFGEATIYELLHQAGDRIHRPDERALLSEWISTLWAIGLWNPQEPQPLFEDLQHRGLDMRGTVWYWPDFGLTWGRKQILFRIPCPLLSGWHPHIHTLSHKLLLAVAVRQYFHENRELAEFIPVLLCSLVAVVGPSAKLTGPAAQFDTDRLRLLGRAFYWLANALPTVALPPKVEDYLTVYAFAQLDRNPPRES
jgi:hypothetical protein